MVVLTKIKIFTYLRGAKILQGRVQFPIGGIVREPGKAEPFKLRYRQLKSGREKKFMKTSIFTLFNRVVLICIALAAPAAQLSASNADTTLTNLPQQKDSVRQVNLNEIKISASFVTGRNSPLRLTTVNSSDILAKAAGLTFPELLKSVPGIYATAETGSYGDAKLNIRGFKQENISVLLNGIPISGLTSGGMYWNNWAGLADVTGMIQVQKGPGASMLSDNSMGGTVNIITSFPAEKREFSAGISAMSYGLYKIRYTANSGILPGQWAFSASLSYAGGKTFAESSDINSWAYMFNISKKISARQSLLITLLGSPEKHLQRSSRLSYEEIKEYGTGYNKNWGYYQDKEKNLSGNFYHKPYLTIFHFFTISPVITLNSAAYLSTGDGGGRWSESKSNSIADIQSEGHIDWNTVIATNRSAETGESLRVLTNYLAGHLQTGAKTGVTLKPGKKLTIEGGVHYQYYNTWEKEVITDLLGGDYWNEDYDSNSLAGTAGRNPVKKAGDEIRLNAGKIINHGTLYSMLSWESAGRDLPVTGSTVVKFGASLMGASVKRRDNYNYPDDPFSKTAYGRGYSIKTGILTKLTTTLSLFANGAVSSRIPYSDTYFSSWNNNITNDLKNEKNYLAEAGFRQTGNRFSAEVTVYAAYRKDKTLMSNPYIIQEEGLNRFMVTGLDAIHKGIEADLTWIPAAGVSLKAFAAIADWRWKNNVTATLHDNYSGQVIGTINVYSDGLPVGDSPQNQVFLRLDYKTGLKLNIYAETGYFWKFYADFEPQNRTDASDNSVYRIPGYENINAGAIYNFKLFGTPATLNLSLNNITNKIHIERGIDGSNHDLATFRGFWSDGISAGAGINIRF
jgi:hypothetical protein